MNKVCREELCQTPGFGIYYNERNVADNAQQLRQIKTSS